MMSGLAAIMTPARRRDALALPEAESKFSYTKSLENSTMLPDHQLGCFDILYYVGVADSLEIFHQHSAAWNIVGTNVRFNKKVESIAMPYLRRLFGVTSDSDIPPVSDVHQPGHGH